jgi:hypothetical protein
MWDSNLVAFYYGNLTHPSVDPPRIGFLSMVPNNANSIVQSDVTQAQANGGNFKSTKRPVITQSLLTSLAGTSQVAPTSIASDISILTSTNTTSASPLSTTSSKSGAQAISSNASVRSASARAALATILLPAVFGTMFAMF